jgi:hypothetical protein
MKTLKHLSGILLAAISAVFIFGSESADLAADPDVLTDESIDLDHKTITIYKASSKDVKQVATWKPSDGDIFSLKELVQLAKKQAKPPENKYQKYEPDPELMLIQWYRSNFAKNNWQTWMVCMELVFHPDKSSEGMIKSRDGDIYAQVYLLPNGASVQFETRPMTRSELLENGLVTPTDEEQKVIDKELKERDRKNGILNDPFAR